MKYPHDAPKCTCGSRCVVDSFNGMYYCWESREQCRNAGKYLTQRDCEILYKAEEEENAHEQTNFK